MGQFWPFVSVIDWSEVSVVTCEIFGENETSLQQVLSGNSIKRSVLCVFVASFIVNWIKTWAVQNFARYDSLAIFPARSRKKSHSLSLAPFLARYHTLSLSLGGLRQKDGQTYRILIARPRLHSMQRGNNRLEKHAVEWMSVEDFHNTHCSAAEIFRETAKKDKTWKTTRVKKKRIIKI